MAGSKPNFFINNGNIEPDKVPHITTPINETPTVKPICIELSPYTLLIIDHTMIRENPIIPRIQPSNKPDSNSLCKTNHQSFKLISPKDKARTIKVAA